MKIIATVRTLNEAKRIGKFCEAYSFADKILVADGGSTDDTIELASTFPNVNIRHYTKKVKLANGVYRNPDGPHIQFLVDWAMDEGADWIIHQDADQRPNKHLKQDVRNVLEKSEKDFIQVTQIYVYERDNYFKKMSFQDGIWLQGLWAWRANINLKIIDKMPHYEFSFDGKNSIDINKTDRFENILPPYCFLHYGWETEKQLQDHIAYYRNSGLMQMNHPTEWYGQPEPLLDWMIE